MAEINPIRDENYDYHRRFAGEADTLVVKEKQVNLFLSKLISTISFGQGLGCRNGEAEMCGT